MSAKKTQSLSLINPDLTGLWSSARLGHKKAWWSKIAGTMVISLFVYSWIGGFLIPFFIVFLFLIGYHLTALILSLLVISPYFISIRPQPWICRIYMKFGAHYFDGGCSINVECPPTEPVTSSTAPICASIHPHGLLCIGYFLTCGIRCKAIENVKERSIREEFVGKLSCNQLIGRVPCKGIIVGYLCKAPLFNLFITKLTGCVSSSSNSNMKAKMRRKEPFGILPGGFNEATIFRKGENSVYIKQRKGFIKYCLVFGYEIFPCFLFGECETYNNLFYSHIEHEWIFNIKQWLNKKKIPTVFPIGPYWYSPFLPFRNLGIHSIISSKSRCQQIDNPTQKQIDDVHTWYMNEIQGIFERNKWRFGYSDDVKLTLV